jgi:hypothetical protein
VTRIEDELPAKMAQRLGRVRIVKPEQRERRETVDARNRVLQERGVPSPKSGTFGKPFKS